jgi:hypothetical protein
LELGCERVRRLDALVYLAQKHGLSFMFVDNCGILQARYRPEELAARQRLLADLARRYATVPGFLFNLDHQEFIRGPNPESDALFRGFLRDRYATAAAFAEAWGQWSPAAGLEGVEFAEPALRKTGPASTPSRDLADFLDTSREAWRRNHADAVHAGNHGALVSQDFSLYWRPDFRWPEPAVMAGLDLVSAHFYGAESDFPVRAKRINMQVIGKPAGLTEFGIMTHGVGAPAAALLALFVGTADVTLPASAGAVPSRLAEFGEFCRQTWQVLQPAADGPELPLRLVASAALRSGMALIAPPARLAECRERAAQILFP